METAAISNRSLCSVSLSDAAAAQSNLGLFVCHTALALVELSFPLSSEVVGSKSKTLQMLAFPNFVTESTSPLLVFVIGERTLTRQ